MLNLTDKRSESPGSEPQTNGAEVAGAQRATFAAGCFWGVEASFREIEGVLKTTVGYTGGIASTRATSRSAPARPATPRRLRSWFDPAMVSYDELLRAFWSLHDPTTPNRQGWDIGSQYRSAIFFHDAEQERQAIASRDERQGALRRPIVTEIVPAAAFYDAEDYHQRYFEKHGGAVCATTVR